MLVKSFPCFTCLLVYVQHVPGTPCLSYLSFSRYQRRAAVIEGCSFVGAWRSRRNPSFSTAFAVAGPNVAMRTSPWLNSGKFFVNALMPVGLKNTSISQSNVLASSSVKSLLTVRYVYVSSDCKTYRCPCCICYTCKVSNAGKSH